MENECRRSSEADSFEIGSSTQNLVETGVFGRKFFFCKFFSIFFPKNGPFPQNFRPVGFVFDLSDRCAWRWWHMTPSEAEGKGAEVKQKRPRPSPKRTPYLIEKVKAVVRKHQENNDTPTKAEVIKDERSRKAEVIKDERSPKKGLKGQEFPVGPGQCHCPPS
jgi:hypothetical protein